VTGGSGGQEVIEERTTTLRLDGKVALVTGGTRGIGAGIVEMLAAEGAAVAFTGRSEDKGAEVERRAKEAGGRALYVRADNGREDEVAGAVRAAVDAFGGLTTLVNNAISDQVGSGRDSHVDTVDNETFDNIMLISLKGAFWASKYAIPEMRKTGAGSIVNISASSSVLSIPTRPAYQASKGAINALTRQMAVDYGKEGIRANTIVVGFVFTGTAEMTAILANPRLRAAFEANVLVPQLGEPADIAAGVVYLASDESKYVTGTQLVIDGGSLCHQAVPELDFDELKSATPGADVG
jgi:meso-butanediol dehydrogenase / (S,S)-butanediol dehydrogenase / diacetyl reductase